NAHFQGPAPPAWFRVQLLRWQRQVYGFRATCAHDLLPCTWHQKIVTPDAFAIDGVTIEPRLFPAMIQAHQVVMLVGGKVGTQRAIARAVDLGDSIRSGAIAGPNDLPYCNKG